jgi:hypothetical protein
LDLRTKLEEPRVRDAVQHAANLNSIIFIAGFLAIVVVGELLESRTTLHRCAALFGIVLIAAVAVGLTTPTPRPEIAPGGAQAEQAA